MKLWQRRAGILKLNWMKLLPAVAGVVVLIFALLQAGSYYAGSARLCASCHEMRPQYTTWKASSHSRVACGRCHENSTGVFGVGQWQQKIGRMLIGHLRDDFSTPIKAREPVSGQRCLKCHTVDRYITLNSDLIIPHARHISEFKVDCTVCHYRVVHGGITEEGYTRERERLNWSEKAGQELLQYLGTDVPMERCMECHRQRRGPVSCETCHREFVKPEDHLLVGWEKKHGQELYQKGTAYCDRCHSITRSKKVEGVSNPFLRYVRENDFCFNCHGNRRPKNHTAGWRYEHSEYVKDYRFNNCLACHDGHKTGSGYRVDKYYCSRCHEI